MCLQDNTSEEERTAQSELIYNLDPQLLDALLYDQTTQRNILWATSDYASLGAAFDTSSEIMPDQITGNYANLIQPRTAKSQTAQTERTRNKAEVFTPSWICNQQNNLVDTQWFGRENVFNIENGTTWTATEGIISFEGTEGWQQYVDAPRMESACGEAPYLVSRYDTVTGKAIPIKQRIGLLDRKMRVVHENVKTAEEWLIWSRRAFESIYGYEYQGDNLLLARENLLYSYMEYYQTQFHQMPDVALLRTIAHIISWNIWQMDGMKYVVPGSCKPEESNQISLFNDDDDESGGTAFSVTTFSACPGCAKGDIFRHTGIYCKIMDWRTERSRTFLSLLKGGEP